VAQEAAVPDYLDGAKIVITCGMSLYSSGKIKPHTVRFSCLNLAITAIVCGNKKHYPLLFPGVTMSAHSTFSDVTRQNVHIKMVEQFSHKYAFEKLRLGLRAKK
jgi:hypothetical protein